MWGRAGRPAPGRVSLPLDVGEEVEQRSPGGSDSAFSSLLQIIVALLIYLSAASNFIFLTENLKSGSCLPNLPCLEWTTWEMETAGRNPGN